ncbi:phospholipid-transporting ATPase 2-like isoform X1 [Cucurbita pepo subsp. pepo]|uniref:phospholipid-transporting ATPase 2-like isoform X1 n=2 Tax=Cucurbita pepo subsp. pepo TaxID=3664 RepID=UPI000C9D77A7|nr:phospholipid-transporting ATPase 2-like isoform X1 [Cucurbita pepo subsp. pepo]XP_023554353.1 phospholipid-transporting ATPase 2-like isoform X1 [Cucurbita pepo subsp. pepo]XP_023554354.1 phospholipid-transporting ATPase 2-like isoform X1 [Cucurbita pepo subsp. pepo]
MMKRYVYINDDEPSNDLFCDNRISNRKYTLLNFLPKNLWEQFSRFMNQYFLLIACLQLWPLITPVNPASTWGPLIFIFAVSATKEAWDDYNRYLSDKKANEKEVWVVKQGTRKTIQAQDIHVGNLVWLRENDEVPSDLVLIGTSDPQGICYIETSALDGETDLKTRVIPSACMGIDFDLLNKIKGVIECPIPDKDITRFDANIRLFPPFIDNDVCPLTIKNTILQSCYLRNTEWVCGVAVYTGNETKLGMSRGVPEPKLTAMDAMIDMLTGAIFVFQLVVVVVLGIAGNVWKDSEARKLWYMQHPEEGPWYELLVIPLRFELLCSIMIPISIKVSLDLVKSLYAKFIDWDYDMIDYESGIPSHATNTAISEDLGQVEYILTDKTGTLTENKMIFRRCCISGIFYGNENGDALRDEKLLDAIASSSPDVIRFLTIMAICNTVVPTKSKCGNIVYKAQSQDEEALVNAAAYLNMVFVNKNANVIEIQFNGMLNRYELLDTLEFTSERKRMSVVIKDCQNGKIVLLSKGADEAILPHAYSGQQTRTFMEAVDQYAQLGLRTLCLAWRELEEDEYREWALMFKEANNTLVDREWRLAEVCLRIERNFEVLGVTAIEDRLQDGVPETIETLRRAGINFWMLTGDKQNTAIQIALLCNFISPEPKGQLLLIDGKTEDEVCRSLERVVLTMKTTTSEPKDVAFVVDGLALEISLKNHRRAFTELAILSRTAICCRVTPSQKAQLVELLKSCDYRTLAIGDGGNDVRMIQQADIGVGISGREGLQAARAADYSIGKFRFLKRLILVHGRYSYNRTAFLSQYSFYKSLLICFIQISFSFISGVSGTSLFNSVSLMAYNVFYTSIPVLVSVLDKDLSEETVMQHPQILFYCQAGRLLNPSTFAGWFGRSLFHAVVVFVISIHAYANEKSEMVEVSMVALSGCIWLQAFVVTLETNSFTMLQLIAIWGNLAAFYVINWIFCAIPSSGMYTIMFRLCGQPSYWITIFLIVGVGMGPLLGIKYFRYTYRPSKINALQQAERLGGPILSLKNIEHQPRPIDEKEDSPLLISQPNNRNTVFEPLLSDSPTAASRRSLASRSSFDFFQTPPSYSINKDK